jgi:hypothetical protein
VLLLGEHIAILKRYFTVEDPTFINSDCWIIYLRLVEREVKMVNTTKTALRLLQIRILSNPKAKPHAHVLMFSDPTVGVCDL